MSATTFEPGETVRCFNRSGYHLLTEGKDYTVVGFEPAFYCRDHASGFHWPAYVTVTGDDGHKITAHAHRFYRPT